MLKITYAYFLKEITFILGENFNNRYVNTSFKIHIHVQHSVSLNLLVVKYPYVITSLKDPLKTMRLISLRCVRYNVSMKELLKKVKSKVLVYISYHHNIFFSFC